MRTVSSSPSKTRRLLACTKDVGLVHRLLYGFLARERSEAARMARCRSPARGSFTSTRTRPTIRAPGRSTQASSTPCAGWCDHFHPKPRPPHTSSPTRRAAAAQPVPTSPAVPPAKPPARLVDSKWTVARSKRARVAIAKHLKFPSGERGIRTHGGLASTPDFESGSFGHSDSSPPRNLPIAKGSVKPERRPGDWITRASPRRKRTSTTCRPTSGNPGKRARRPSASGLL